MEDIKENVSSNHDTMRESNLTFDMTEQQVAYTFGRLTSKSGSCQLYQEFESEDIDVYKVEKAVNTLIKHHQMLRCVIHANGKQSILADTPKYSVETFIIEEKSPETKSTVENIREKMINTEFELDQWPFFSICVSKSDQTKDRLHCAVDLAIADGNSIHLLFKQILALYANPDSVIRPLGVSFFDYVKYKDEDHRNNSFQSYWQKKFDALPPGPTLDKVKRNNNLSLKPHHKRVSRSLDNWQGLLALAETENVSANAILLAVYSEVIARRETSSEFGIVIPSWKREDIHEDINSVIGDFTSLSWLHVNDENLSLREKILVTDESLKEDFKHRIHKPLTLLSKVYRKKKQGVPNFPVVFTDLLPHGEYSSSEFSFSYSETKTPGVFLDCISVLVDGKMQLSWDYDCQILDDEPLEEMFNEYVDILDALIKDPSFIDKKTHTIKIRTNTLVLENTAMKLDKRYPGSHCLHTYIEDCVDKNPNDTAVVFEGQSLTYHELNQQANLYSSMLIENGVRSNDIVAIFMDRSLEMVVSMLAILKAGAAYLPLDPNNPESRTQYILEDANVAMVLTSHDREPALSGFSQKNMVVTVGDCPNEIPNPVLPVSSGQLAYVIYTSGSTGNPKGCMLPHQAVSNRIFWMQDEYQLTSSDKVLQKTPYTFDVSVWEFFWPLMMGAKLVLAKPGGHKDSRYLVDFICKHNITICHFVPSMLAFFLSEAKVKSCVSLRSVFVSGEALPYSSLVKFQDILPAQLHNLYGPTEAAIDVTSWACQKRDDGIVPIGKPITNIKIYILDDELKPVQDGREGELYIAGIGLALGYLNRPELTKERFVPNPFEENSTMYRTGDLGRWLPDGNIEYIGRTDFQIKLRGFRIELGEIENAMRRFVDVEDCVTVVQEKDSTDPKLVAYYVSANNAPLEVKKLKSHLAGLLPEYFIPNFFVAINKLPVTVHGKLDRKQLPWPVEKRREVQSIDTLTQDDGLSSSEGKIFREKNVENYEGKLRNKIAELLHLTDIDVQEDLFDAGATSLTLVNIGQYIETAFGVVIPTSEFFEGFMADPTVAWIAQCVQRLSTQENNGPVSITHIEETLTGKFVEILKVADIRVQEDLFDTGATSLTLVNIGQFIEAVFGVSIPTSEFFEGFMAEPTIAWIAQCVQRLITHENNEPASITHIEEKLTEKFVEILKVTDIHVQKDLFDAGATSLTLVNIGQYIEAEFEVVIPPSEFFEGFMTDPTIHWIAQCVQRHNGGENNSQKGAIEIHSATSHTVSSADATVIANNQTQKPEKDLLLSDVLTLFRTSLSDELLTVDDDLFDHGATSLTLVSACQQISDKYSIEVTVSDFFDDFMANPTVRWVANHIASALVGAKQEETQFAAFDSSHALKHIDLEDVVYQKKTAPIDSSPASESMHCQQLSEVLALLRGVNVEGENELKYLYPSVGGKQAIQTYLYINADKFGLATGTYYYHPEEHALYFLSEGEIPSLASQKSRDGDERCADFALFFVAQLKAIQPIYQNHSIRLATIESGYMAQLLESRQKKYGVHFIGAGNIPLDEAFIHLKLDDGHQILYSLLAWKKNIDSDGIKDRYLTGDSFLPSSFMDNFIHSSDMSSLRRLSDEETELLSKEQWHLRKDLELTRVIPLIAQEQEPDCYRVRKCERSYLDREIPFSSFSRFIALLRHRDEAAVAERLYSLQGDNSLLSIYVYVKHGAVEGIEEGLYQYIPTEHKLHLLTQNLDKSLLACHVPFNRLHYKASGFTIFFVASGPATNSNMSDNFAYLASLESGQIGQLLLDHQAEFNIGLCPLGGMNFDRVKDAFKLDDKDILVHQLIGGYVERRDIDCHINALNTVGDKKIQNHFENEPQGKIETRVVDKREEETTMDFAVVGLSGRYPGAETIQEFWENLRSGKRSFRSIPSGRGWQGLDTKGDGSDTYWGGFLSEVDTFDSLLFNISPMEARLMDPQERLFLENVWECLENAGYSEKALNESATVGVFVGAMWNDYLNVGERSWLQGGVAQATSLHSDIANRVSHFFNFQGPSISIGTSCSSALSSIHFACESILRGDCDTAIAGGVNIVSHPYHLEALSEHELLSTGDKSSAFSAEASGWVVGEGVGAVLIKSLTKARVDNDHIYCVIKGTSVSHSGRSSRYGMANSTAQTESIKKLLRRTGTDANSVSYIECAAGGSSIADASEINAIVNALDTPLGMPCMLGSVKPNVGHCESASGMSQLTKVIFQLNDRQIAPSLDCDPVNPLIQLKNTRFSINRTLSDWDELYAEQRHKKPLTALINGFGASGSCSHILIEEYRENIDSICSEDNTLSPQIIILSAATPAQLQVYCQRLAKYLIECKETASLASVAQTLKFGRVEMDHRLAFIANSSEEAIKVLLDASQNLNIDAPRLFYADSEDSEQSSGHYWEDKSPADIVAKNWVHGAEVEWTYNRRLKKQPLPTYPFAKHKHWLNLETPKVVHQKKNDASHTMLRSTQNYLKEVFSSESGIDELTLKLDKDFSSYGINSLMITRMNARLAKDFGDIPKSVFFEYRNIRQLSEYFLANQRDALVRLFGDIGEEIPKAKPPVNSTYQHLSHRTVERDTNEPIAIVGMAGRFPKANNLEEYWHNLKAGKNCIGDMSDERKALNKEITSFFNRVGERQAGFIDEVDCFDPLFFGISPAWAEMMDPQERIFLQVAWESMENAGYSQQSLVDLCESNVGVFVGVMYNEYQMYGPVHQEGDDIKALSPGYGSIANRVSFHLGFNGPSMAIDTMCSSSLTALHLAAESIKRGECQAAIVGGTNLLVHPNKSILHDQFKMRSKDGLCKSFGEGGDGFVVGEGVAAVMLKPLRQAESDGDTIYGVIKGSTINHGGKANGYTVPSPKSQRDLIRVALAKADVDPRTISYVEAHGTGTALGDPIEVEGLCEAFREYTQERNYCALGSVKSNIGHLESAAGVAALTKVLLQFKYQQLVPSLHSEKLNPEINFQDSPFYVQQTLEHWQQPEIKRDGQMTRIPRRAGISSFGAGGSNAHVIVEEYLQADKNRVDRVVSFEGPYVFVLSAKSVEQLNRYVEKISYFVESYLTKTERSDSEAAAFLQDMIYTLQAGRDALEIRVAFVIRSLAELAETLRHYNVDTSPGITIYRGSVYDKHESDIFADLDEDIANEMINAVAKKGDCEKLAQLWVKGFDIDWLALVHYDVPKRIALPAYPFAKDHYWISGDQHRFSHPEDGSSNHVETKIHPLIDLNVSTLARQQYLKCLHRDAYYLSDHQVQGRCVLPGVAHIEMARAATCLAAETDVLRMKDILWFSPVIVEENAEVLINLEPESDCVRYEIASGNKETENVVHSSGSLYLSRAEDIVSTKIDVSLLKQGCERITEGEDFYKTVANTTLRYGDSFRTVSRIYSFSEELLVELKPSHEISNFSEAFGLPLGLFDGALQATYMLIDETLRQEGATFIPFSVRQIDLISIDQTWSIAHVKKNTTLVSDNKNAEQHFDIQILNEQGDVVVRIDGFSLRRIVTDSDIEFSRNKIPEEISYFSSVWEEKALPENENTSNLTDSEAIVVLVSKGEDVEKLKTAFGTINTVFVSLSNAYSKVSPQHYLIDEASEEDYMALFSSLSDNGVGYKKIIYWNIPTKDDYVIFPITCLTKALVKRHRHNDGDIQLLHVFHEVTPADYAMCGFSRSLKKENPRFSYRSIQLPHGIKTEKSVQIILNEFNSGGEQDILVRYQKERYVQRLKALAPSVKQKNTLHLKQHGSYIITGGLGGLGYIFARYFAEYYEAQLILTGRSSLSNEQEKILESLEQLGGTVHYLPSDVTHASDCIKLVSYAKQKCGDINGIIHAAGVLDDGLLMGKTRETIERVVQPKALGAQLLDYHTQQEDLDFFILFSSLVAKVGNIGQSDYAYANAYLDGFAQTREELREQGLRRGATCSINWPYWEEGGMPLDESSIQHFIDTAGIVPLREHLGLEAFETILSLSENQVVVLASLTDRRDDAHQWLKEGKTSQAKKEKAVTAEIGSQEGLKKQIEDYLKALVSRQTKLDAEKINSHEALDRYGIDSIMILDITSALEKILGQVSKTIFFEHQTIEDVSQYLIEQHGTRLAEHFQNTTNENSDVLQANSLVSKRARSLAKSRDEKSLAFDQVDRKDDIAIIGLAGRYPMADDIAQFWENLEVGRDCITEIPKERWDYRKYYDENPEKEGKSYAKWGGFLNDIDKFDPFFFKITPSDAKYLDPQQRIFLETVYHAIEDAGYTKDTLAGHSGDRNVGVFAGVMWADYRLYGIERFKTEGVKIPHSSHWGVANRISYTFDFQGPSFVVDTACSSSLSAIHMAVDSLRKGECRAAIAGGVNISIHPSKFQILSQDKFASQDGRCRSFGDGGTGYVPGEGSGAVVLKPLSRALQDGDHVYGVIKASTVNHGGKTNGFTVPNPKAQTKLIKRALAEAGVNPEEISYLEAHGTGTSLGDPIEIAGLNEAFRAYGGGAEKYCAIGSVKSNIGHLEAAAGIAGLTKVLLQMKHKKLVPSLHSEPPNPKVAFDGSPFYVQRELEKWTPVSKSEDADVKADTRIAAISSFGAGGANAHLVVGEYVDGQHKSTVSESNDNENEHLIVLSAKTEPQLIEILNNLLHFIDLNRHYNVSDIAYTLQIGRETFKHKLAFVAKSLPDMVNKIQDALNQGFESNRLYYAKKKQDLRQDLEGYASENDFIRHCIVQGELATLAKYWVNGGEMDWYHYHKLSGGKYTRVSLPGYPFEKDRYWLPYGEEITQHTEDA